MKYTVLSIQVVKYFCSEYKKKWTNTVYLYTFKVFLHKTTEKNISKSKAVFKNLNTITQKA